MLISVIINDLTLEKSNRNTMSPALGTNGGRSKSNTVFMRFCIECNGKSLKFASVSKIKVTSMRKILVSLRYVMYIHKICEKTKQTTTKKKKKKKKKKTGGHRS